MSILASDVEAVIAHLQLDDYVIVGLSMGAKVAQLVGAHRLHRTKRHLQLSRAMVMSQPHCTHLQCNALVSGAFPFRSLILSRVTRIHGHSSLLVVLRCPFLVL